MDDERTPPPALRVVPDLEVVRNHHREAAVALDGLAARTRKVERALGMVGLDIGRALRVELRKNVRLTFRLLELQFADLTLAANYHTNYHTEKT